MSIGLNAFPKDTANYKKSSSCNNFSDATGGFVDVTNLTVTIKTSGRPVLVMIVGDDSAASYFESSNNVAHAAASTTAFIKVLNGSTLIGETSFASYYLTGTQINDIKVPASFSCLDIPAAGTQTYKVQASSFDANQTVGVFSCKLVAIEL